MTCITSGTIAVTCYCEISVRFNAVDSHRGAEMTPKFKVSLSVQECKEAVAFSLQRAVSGMAVLGKVIS